jgi:hypothetical protein
MDGSTRLAALALLATLGMAAQGAVAPVRALGASRKALAKSKAIRPALG